MTPLSPEARIAPMVAGVAQPTVVLGHTHVQFDRTAAGTRLVNAGSVGMPYEGAAAAFWALLGPRRGAAPDARYDVAAFAARVRASEDPGGRDLAEGLEQLRPAPTRRTTFFERMATRPPPG